MAGKILKHLCVLFFLGLLASCGTTQKTFEKKDTYNIALEKVSYDDLPAWDKGVQSEFVPIMRNVCLQIKSFVFNRNIGTPSIVIYPYDFYATCEDLRKTFINSSSDMRYFIKQHFVPYLVLGKPEVNTGHDPISTGLFTGYFKPVLEGSRVRTSVYKYPIFERPHDLIIKSYLGNNGILYGRYDENGRFVRYYTRKQIDTEQYTSTHKVLFWLKDPIDVAILQVQGSGTINLPNGRSVNVSYAANNGWDYYPISHWFIEFKHYSKDVVSWQFIRKWVKEHPYEYRDALNSNPRYIFFKVSSHNATVGAFGTPLTATRSLAVDKKYVPLGLPLWVNTKWPITGKSMNRLMASEDIGGGVSGPIRGDIYWGEGDVAFSFANQMNYPGYYYLLLPRDASKRIDNLN